MPNLTEEDNRLGKRALAATGPWAGGMTAARGCGYDEALVVALEGGR